MCVGAQKAGTGWLYEQLRSHPDFWMPPLKEIHYFDRFGAGRPARPGKTDDRVAATKRDASDERDMRFLDTMSELQNKRELDLNVYAQLFEPKGPLLSGDITPGYSTLDEDVVRRIAGFFPKLKTVFIARDPVERAWSQLSMWVRHGIIDKFDEGDVDAVRRHLELPGVKNRSYPSRIVARWRSFFRNRFALYFFDDLGRDPAKVRRGVIEFLGGDPTKASGELAANHNPKASKEKLPFDAGVRAELAKFFEHELKACATELGGPATRWPARYGF